MWFRNLINHLIQIFTNLYNQWVIKNNPPVPPSPNPSTDTKIGQIILDKNAQIPVSPDPLTLSVWNTKGVRLHRIDRPMANEIGTIVEQAAAANKIPLSYLMACIAIESAFDPQASNGNFLGTNKTTVPNGWGPDARPTTNGHDPGGFDMGACQLKLKYLIGNRGLTTIQQALDFAMDVNMAIPYMSDAMSTKLIWADVQIPHIQQILDDESALEGLDPTSDKYKTLMDRILTNEKALGFSLNQSLGVPEINPKSTDRYWLATAAYNYGNTGTMVHLQNNDFPGHPDQVAALEELFAKDLGLPSVMAHLQ